MFPEFRGASWAVCVPVFPDRRREVWDRARRDAVLAVLYRGVLFREAEACAREQQCLEPEVCAAGAGEARRGVSAEAGKR